MGSDESPNGRAQARKCGIEAGIGVNASVRPLLPGDTARYGAMGTRRRLFRVTSSK